ncbi:MAG: hypothetical protein ACRCYZ_01895 [Alphaproteobacteria bacterium]
MPRYLKIFQVSLYLMASTLLSSQSSAGLGSLSKASGSFFNKRIVKLSEKGVIDLKDIEMTSDMFEKMLNELASLSDDEKKAVKEFVLNSSYTTVPKLKELKEGAVSKLLALLPEFPNLINLELAGLQLDKERRGLDALKTLKRLQSADLGRNNFDYATAQEIVNTLLPLPEFKMLILKESNLNDQEKEKLKDQFEIWKPSPTGTTWNPLLDI